MFGCLFYDNGTPLAVERRCRHGMVGHKYVRFSRWTSAGVEGLVVSGQPVILMVAVSCHRKAGTPYLDRLSR